jgi:hypothetical protein
MHSWPLHPPILQPDFTGWVTWILVMLGLGDTHTSTGSHGALTHLT